MEGLKRQRTPIAVAKELSTLGIELTLWMERTTAVDHYLGIECAGDQSISQSTVKMSCIAAAATGRALRISLHKAYLFEVEQHKTGTNDRIGLPQWSDP
jgi:hypothetical protein